DRQDKLQRLLQLESQIGNQSRPRQDVHKIQKMVVGVELKRGMLVDGQASRCAVNKKQSRERKARQGAARKRQRSPVDRFQGKVLARRPAQNSCPGGTPWYDRLEVEPFSLVDRRLV